ncbi:MAG: GEGP motif-containing diheme protein [Thermodesulfobacteriota bacterium]|nr:GEGP motif-containing diheme protein [Thermodesulfobacteriota bacterium]
MKKTIVAFGSILLVGLMTSVAFCAYHHEGEEDAAKFLEAYPDKAGTKLDHCALCHSGGQYEKKPDVWVTLGSCQWCHYSYGYDGSGNLGGTMNSYGLDYLSEGRSPAAVTAIENEDSDEDGYSNIAEITANRFPGDPDDDPSQVVASYRLYTKAQLEAMPSHTQFMLMNASRQPDDYVEYTGVPVEDLLDDAGIFETATGITVIAPDGWSNYHPLELDEEPELYHVKGTYPQASFYYHDDADISKNPEDGWCDYSAPSCEGRVNGEAIQVPGGLKMILAYKRDGTYLDPGILNQDNKLDGEGPYRVVPPQKNPGPPDQSSSAENQDVEWPYTNDWDHNKGAASRTATIIRVEPLPEGTTDIDILEAGWDYVDQEKIIIYGAIDGDSDGNGIPDSEEGDGDVDDDGIPDRMDKDTAVFRHAEGIETISLHIPTGEFAGVEALSDDDPALPQDGKPSLSFPYGTMDFSIVGLTEGESVTVTIALPDDVPTTAQYFKIDGTSGWHAIDFESNDGDNTITITLTDGDSETDADGVADGTISDPSALAVPEEGKPAKKGGDSGPCFVGVLGNLSHGGLVALVFGVCLAGFLSITLVSKASKLKRG